MTGAVAGRSRGGVLGRAGARAAAGWSWLARTVRVHWQFAILLALGALLRACAFFAYRPALIFTDSIGYLANRANLGPRPLRPFGYPVFLHLLPFRFGLEIVPLVQHLLGLGLAVVIYVLLLRLGVARWLAALAAAPVLLDAMQLNLEQQILSETLFEVLLLGACALLLWWPRVGLVAAGLAGTSLAAAALTRSVAELVIVPAVLVLLLLRVRLLQHRRDDRSVRAAAPRLRRLVPRRLRDLRAERPGRALPVRAGGAVRRLQGALDARLRARALPNAAGGQAADGRAVLVVAALADLPHAPARRASARPACRGAGARRSRATSPSA